VAPAAGVLNEIDTIPGFTSIGMYPKMWERSGIGFGALLDRLMESGIARRRKRGSRGEGTAPFSASRPRVLC
jgi:hypothetical protein